MTGATAAAPDDRFNLLRVRVSSAHRRHQSSRESALGMLFPISQFVEERRMANKVGDIDRLTAGQKARGAPRSSSWFAIFQDT
jgi:hypothetical protein